MSSGNDVFGLLCMGEHPALSLSVIALTSLLALCACSSESSSNTHEGCDGPSCDGVMTAPACEIPVDQRACVPLDPEWVCERDGRDCGQYTTRNGCGGEVTVDCGSCADGVACGTDSPNVCDCACRILGDCVPDGAVNPEDHCLACQPERSENDWTAIANCEQEISAGDGFWCSRNRQGRVQCGGTERAGNARTPTDTFTRLSTGHDHACGITEDARIRCWGGNDYGQLSAPDDLEPIRVSAGRRHSCAVAESGAVHCWGSNDYGQLDAPDERFVDVAAGQYHTCGITERGTLRCWGWGARTYAAEAPLGKFVRVVTGERHTCALSENGRIVCWGSDWWGESTAPPGNYTDLAAGGYRTCAVDEFGRLVCWGQKLDGLEYYSCRAFADVSVGSSTCALDTAGNRYCWSH
jgi:hypothetical protein